MMVGRAVLILVLHLPSLCHVPGALGAVPVEVAYDDGTRERTIVWNERGNGVAVRFSVEPGSTLLGARFYISWAPFWNPLGVCVLNASGPAGAPGDTLVRYFEEPLDSFPGFQNVAFRAPVPLPDRDFYVVYLQTRGLSGDSNTFGIDMTSPPDGRSWLYQSGVWSQMPPESGDVMIRAILAVETPVAPSTWAAIKSCYR